MMQQVTDSTHGMENKTEFDWRDITYRYSIHIKHIIDKNEITEVKNVFWESSILK